MDVQAETLVVLKGIRIAVQLLVLLTIVLILISAGN